MRKRASFNLKKNSKKIVPEIQKELVNTALVNVKPSNPENIDAEFDTLLKDNYNCVKEIQFNVLQPRVPKVAFFK